ncbi:MAG: LptF/LptG family permease [bacterium]|nr:LptF/LptG family permease [bacterium]
MNQFLLRKIDKLILGEFIPFFLMGVAAFTLLMIAVTLFKDMLNYVTTYGLTVAQVGIFFVLALPQTVAYTLPMAILFATLLAFGRLSEASEITALRAGGIGFFRIVLPALVFAWFVVLMTFLLSEKIAPQSTYTAKQYIQNALIEKGITVQPTDISYMDQDAGWLFAAARADGNTFYDVKWWDFSRPGEITLSLADDGVWEDGKWEFHNARVITLGLGDGKPDEGIIGTSDSGDESNQSERGYRYMTSPSLSMDINRTPSNIMMEGNRDPEEMSLQELRAYIDSPEVLERPAKYILKLQGTYCLKIAAPFASIVFTLLAAPLGLTPTRSTSTMGIGLSMLLVFAYYLLTTFSVKIAEGGFLIPVLAAWLPNIIFLIAGAVLNARFYIRSG